MHSVRTAFLIVLQSDDETAYQALVLLKKIIETSEQQIRINEFFAKMNSFEHKYIKNM